jgi:3-dehydroshikimate dehydratase
VAVAAPGRRRRGVALTAAAAEPLRPGLVTVTFRRLPPRTVVGLAAAAGLDGIEWAGDGHVPAGDPATAGTVAALTADHGLEVVSYGSYYRAGAPPAENPPFGAVLESATALGSPAVRVWAGRLGSASADLDYRRRVVDDLRRICELAQAAAVEVRLEYHRNTLTDSRPSTQALVRAVGHPLLGSLWQPRGDVAVEVNVADLHALRPVLGHLHAFSWTPERRRLPLARHRHRWQRYLRAATPTAGSRWVLLEFVRDDDEAVFREDARALRRLIASVQGAGARRSAAGGQ